MWFTGWNICRCKHSSSYQAGEDAWEWRKTYNCELDFTISFAWRSDTVSKNSDTVIRFLLNLGRRYKEGVLSSSRRWKVFAIAWPSIYYVKQSVMVICADHHSEHRRAVSVDKSVFFLERWMHGDGIWTLMLYTNEAESSIINMYRRRNTGNEL